MAVESLTIKHQDYIELENSIDGVLVINFETDNTVQSLIDALVAL